MLLQGENSEAARKWIKDNCFTSHEAVTEQINILDQTLLRKGLALIIEDMYNCPAYYSIIADEATDVCNSE